MNNFFRYKIDCFVNLDHVVFIYKGVGGYRLDLEGDTSLTVDKAFEKSLLSKLNDE